MKISLVDKLFSLFIRDRDDWRCQRCFTQYSHPTMGLHNSHYFGRTKKSVRFDPQNCDALCWGCHRIWEKEDREGYRNFKIKQLGEKAHDALILRANMPQKIDYKMILMGLKVILKSKGLYPPKKKESYGEVLGKRAK